MMKSEKGFSLMEVMVAIALLGLVSVAFLGAVSTASNAIFVADEQTTAESIARAEMEYVRSQDYAAAPWAYELPSTPPSWDATHTLPPGYEGYIVNVSAVALYSANDIQRITVTVGHLDDPELISLESYRTMRR